jgi:hypothetical protein
MREHKKPSVHSKKKKTAEKKDSKKPPMQKRCFVF